MSPPRALLERVAAALDAALVAPSPELVRAAAQDGAAAHAKLLARALLALPPEQFSEALPLDLSFQADPGSRQGPPRTRDPPVSQDLTHRPSHSGEDIEVAASGPDPPAPTSGPDPPAPRDLSLQSPGSPAPASPDPPPPRDPSLRTSLTVARAGPDPPASRDLIARPSPAVAFPGPDPPAPDPASCDLPLRPSASLARAGPDPPAPRRRPPISTPLALPGPDPPAPASESPVPSDLSLGPAEIAARPLSPRLPVEALGEVYAALAGRRIVRLDPGAFPLRDLHGRTTWISLPELLAAPHASRAHHLRGLGLSREAARRCAHELAGVDDEAVARHILARARGDPPAAGRPGDLVFQTSPDRRRAGAHYTPRHLADTVVRAALRPLLAALGPAPTADQLLRLKICDPAMGCGAFLLAVARRLALHLVTAWERAGDLPPDPHRLARRLVVERCVFGVDADPFAVALARRSLWLLFGTGEPPDGFLFKNLRHGDALLGLDLAGLRAFHWRPAPAQPAIAAAIARDPELAARLGDLVVGAFLSQRTDRDRERERRRRLLAVEAALAGGSDLPAFPVPAPLAPPLHWPLAFSHSFDAFVGNPPFLGGSQISGAFGDPYLAWLLVLHPGAHGNADLCAHFLRRVDDLLAASGTIGFIATNTIGQGDTRTTGLQPLLARGHVLYEVTRDLPWPEAAAVTVAIVHLARGPAAAAAAPYLLREPASHLSREPSAPSLRDPPALDLSRRPATDRLDSPAPAARDPAAPDLSHRPAPDALDSPAPTHRARVVAGLTSHLHAGSERPDPRPLAANRRIAFAGSKVYGQGFLLTAVERAELVARDPRNASRIFPYLGGDDIAHAGGPRRFVINFGACSLAEAEAWPDLLALVRERVKPERDRNPREVRRRLWWRFGEPAPGLYAALRGLDRCVVNSQVGKHLVFDLVATDYVYSHTTYVYASPAPLSLFAVLQSRVHELWARHLASSMKTDLRYSISDCFNNFPFPAAGPRVDTPALATSAARLLAARAAALAGAPRSLTALYNALLGPRHEPLLDALRTAHDLLDRAVLDAYAWSDLRLPAWPQPLAGEPVAAELFDRLLAANACAAQ
ncbi:type IIL restriction-modification enzyme MmeI [Nannocystis pusilla]|uniref:type IIL restriction-modification enzyme MmeI n=1 Tax=Nannocystis pusilla TaxID=889268 RepID=UPI003DA444EA